MSRFPVVFAALLIATSVQAESVAGLKVPPGFEVTEFAGNDLVPDCSCLTTDAKGQVTVAGPGYIRVLLADAKTGRATAARDVAKGVKGSAHGLLWDGDTLLAVVDGGLRRFRPDGTSEVIRKLKTGGEHDAHAILRHPDGWLYLLCGNSTGIDRSFATLPTSPIRDPIAGCIVRLSPDFKNSEIVADGFRNPYGFTLNERNEILTFDSDNERCVSLPWYEPTRLYRVAIGGHHGWRNPQRSETWRSPPYFLDVVPPVATLGRGSPTGVVGYHHNQFPAKYRRGTFCLDWTFGKIWFVSRSFEKPEPFLEATGSNGFAPTAAAVDPVSGDLVVSVGGRGTRGGVYRVRCTRPNVDPVRVTFPVPRSVAWRDELQTELPRAAASGDPTALIDLYRHRGRFNNPALMQAVLAHWDAEDHGHCVAAARLIAALADADRKDLRKKAETNRHLITLGLALVESEPATAIDLARQAYETGTVAQRLDAVRVIQLALGDLTAPAVKGQVWEGYTPQRPLPADRHPDLRTLLREAFPAGHADLDRELSRTLAMLEDDWVSARSDVLAKITPESDPIEDIHYLIVAARLRAARVASQTQATTEALVNLDAKIAQRKLNRDRNWPLRIAEQHAELARKDSRLNAMILNHPAFGRSDHALFARCPGFDRKKAAIAFVAWRKAKPDLGWNAELVGLLAELPADERRLLLRKLADEGLQEAALPLLAAVAEPGDAPRLLAGLTAPRLATVTACADALGRLPASDSAETLFALVRGLRLLPDGKEGDALRKRLAGLLARATGQDLGTDRQRWADWLAGRHPGLANRLAGPDGVDVAAWRKRLAGIDWAAGDAGRGKAAFAKASCAACHSGNQALGPDLRGVAGRFSRDDLFAAIVQPSKDISPRYRTTQIETTDGKTFAGLVVYEAVDGVILQTGPAETVRVAGDRVESRRLTETSMMPAGLLDRMSDAEVADLYAYLRAGFTGSSH